MITIASLALIVGVVGGSYLKINRAGAQTAAPSVPSTPDNSKTPLGGHVGQNGVREERLTGDLETRAREAALKAVPGGTIQILETDAEGAVYEAHMTRPDGSRVTIKFDKDFNVTATEEGKGKKVAPAEST